MKERRWWIVVLALFLLRFVLSLRGLDYGLPEAHEPDVELVRQSLHFRGEALAKPEQLAFYPHLISRLMALVPRPGAVSTTPSDERLEAHLAFAARHILAARQCIALIAACAVPLTWFLARPFMGPGWSVLASALLASSLLHFDFSQQARPHGALTTFVLAAMLSCAALAKKPNGWRYLLAGITSALALSALQSGALVLIAGLCAHGIAMRGKRPRNHLWLTIPFACVTVGIVLFYPFLLDGAAWRSTGADESEIETFPQRLNTFDGSGFAKLLLFLGDYDPTVWILAVAGFVLWLIRSLRSRSIGSKDSKTELIVYSCALIAYVLVIGCYSRVFARFLEPIMPFVCVIGAQIVREFSICVKWLARSRLATVALCFGLLAFPSYLVVRLANLRAGTDTFTECAVWVSEHAVLARDRILLSPTLSLPLFHTIVRAEDYSPWSSPASHFWHRYLWDLPVESLGEPLYDVRYIARGGRPYMGLKDYPKNETRAAEFLETLRGRYAIVTAGGTLLDCVRDAVAEHGTLVHTISPWFSGGPEDPAGMEFNGRRFWSKLLHAQHHGPLLEIYRLQPMR